MSQADDALIRAQETKIADTARKLDEEHALLRDIRRWKLPPSGTARTEALDRQSSAIARKQETINNLESRLSRQRDYLHNLRNKHADL